MQYIDIFLIFTVSLLGLIIISEGERSLIHSIKLMSSTSISAETYTLTFPFIIQDCILISEITLCNQGIRDWIIIDEAYDES